MRDRRVASTANGHIPPGLICVVFHRVEPLEVRPRMKLKNMAKEVGLYGFAAVHPRADLEKTILLRISAPNPFFALTSQTVTQHVKGFFRTI